MPNFVNGPYLVTTGLVGSTLQIYIDLRVMLFNVVPKKFAMQNIDTFLSKYEVGN